VALRITDSNSAGSLSGVTFADIFFTFTITEAIEDYEPGEEEIEED